jgi:hypothetical protein
MNITIKSENGELVGGGSEWKAELRLVLDEDGNTVLYVKDRHSSDNGTSSDEWHGRDQVWTNRNPSCGVVDLEALEQLAKDVSPLLDRVHAGHNVEWDGSNMVGTLDDDAQEASELIEKLVMDCEWANDQIAVWDASDWIDSNWREVAADLKLTATSTQDEKNAAEKALDKMASGDNCRLLHTDIAIDWLVEKLQEEADEAQEAADEARSDAIDELVDYLDGKLRDGVDAEVIAQEIVDANDGSGHGEVRGIYTVSGNPLVVSFKVTSTPA